MFVQARLLREHGIDSKCGNVHKNVALPEMLSKLSLLHESNFLYGMFDEHVFIRRGLYWSM